MRTIVSSFPSLFIALRGELFSNPLARSVRIDECGALSTDTVQTLAFGAGMLGYGQERHGWYSLVNPSQRPPQVSFCSVPRPFWVEDRCEI
jgi:hypothetical protein